MKRLGSRVWGIGYGPTVRGLIPDPRPLFFEKRLQNQRRRYLVDNPSVLLPQPPGLIQNLVCFARGQPLIPQVNVQSRERSKLGSKRLRLGSLGAGLAGQMHWIANHDPHHAKAPGQSRQRPQVLS